MIDRPTLMVKNSNFLGHYIELKVISESICSTNRSYSPSKKGFHECRCSWVKFACCSSFTGHNYWIPANQAKYRSGRSSCDILLSAFLAAIRKRGMSLALNESGMDPDGRKSRILSWVTSKADRLAGFDTKYSNCTSTDS